MAIQAMDDVRREELRTEPAQVAAALMGGAAPVPTGRKSAPSMLAARLACARAVTTGRNPSLHQFAELLLRAWW